MTRRPRLKRPSINPAVLVLIVLVVALVGSLAVTRFIAAEQARELLSWQNRLNLIADSRVADVDAWLGRNFKELGAVADNPSLQIYLTELVAASSAKVREEPAQQVFLRNLLSMTADRLGFVAPPSKEIRSIKADVATPSGVGVAIVDTRGKVLVATQGVPVLDPDLADVWAGVSKDKPSFIDVFASASGGARFGFSLPVYPIQADARTAKPIGYLVAVKKVGDELFSLLKHPGVIEESLEAVLLRKEGGNVVYLSPVKAGEGKGASTLALNTPDLDAAYALTETGTFALKKDGASRPTLVTSRSVKLAPWVLMLHIDRDQAMGESDVRLRQLRYILFFALLAMIGFMVAIWYYGTSKRTLLLSRETQRMAERSAAQEKLLRVVADNQLEPIVIADAGNIVRFANAKAARAFQMDEADVGGKDLVAIMGSSRAKGYEVANKLALDHQAPHVRTWSFESEAGTTSIVRSEHIPLPHVPVDGLPVPTPGVLMIDQDITEIVREREHRVRMLRQVIEMLVTMVDRRDPYAASHSACVALVAREVAVGMGLDRQRVETAETAGNLMNIGKIIVPSEVLTKRSALTEAEKKSIADSLQSSIGLLEKIEFDGPVVDTLRQAREYYDGTGPLHLKGEEILVTARIIAVVNAFVGMISVRAYRKALDMDQAIKLLLSQMDVQFDRRVVVALADYIENGPGRQVVTKLIPSEP